jgi:outer membrane protein
MMKRNLLTTCFGAAALIGALPAYSQDVAPVSNWAVGLAAVSSVSPYRGYDQKVWPFPAVSYDGSRYYLQGLDGGFYLAKNESYDFSIDASIATNYFRASDTTDVQLKTLKTRDPSFMTGLRYRYHADWGFLQLKVAQDVSGNSQGQTAQAEYGYPMNVGALTFIPSVGQVWNSSKFNSYYYGVSSAEAARSSLGNYNPGSSVSPFAKLAASYRFSQSWSAFAQVSYTHFPDEISRSPMVGTKGLTGYLVGVSYHF